MKTVDWSNIYKNHKGKWVALADDERTVLAVATDVKQVIKKALDAGHKNPILTKMPQKLLTYVGSRI